MRAFIFTALVLAAFGVLLRLVHLATANYPRMDSISRGTEAVMVLIGFLWCLWALHLLTN